MSENDGGPAFPHHEAQFLPDGTIKMLHEYGLCRPGMSLRDWFAGRAMQGIFANSSIDLTIGDHAELAYAVADAMIAEATRLAGE
ncbi:hypothetical protein LCGC14_0901880 [marine sediment metagenome]|uniref:Uncharacterized protein n=1 Tax=marine sediment metagenome TaxID=412755 RepID=A0A0F9P119_9ZZZZ